MDTTNFANGQVVTGYSFPVVALYNHNAGTVSYTSGMDLARGVNVNPQIEVANENNTLYLNNRAAEEGQRRFRRGTLNLGVDGLLVVAEKLVMGIPAAAARSVTVGESNVKFTAYGEAQKIPYVGVGFVVRCQSNGNVFYFAFVYRKLTFSQFDIPATTEGENIDWQTQSLSARILVDDTTAHDWKWFSEPLATELEAYNAARAALDMSTVTELPVS